jgi:hypothetical protein
MVSKLIGRILSREDEFYGEFAFRVFSNSDPSDTFVALTGVSREFRVDPLIPEFFRFP